MVAQALRVSNAKGLEASSTFVRNMRLPVHGWFRFPAGFSAEWVRTVVDEHKERTRDLVFLDPFAGVGTAILAAEEAGVTAFGLEAQPFIARIAKVKLLWHTDAAGFGEFARLVLETAQANKTPAPRYPDLIHKCYSEEALRDLHNLKCAWGNLADDSADSELTWLALVSILRLCSHAGTAPWQYILPNKSKTKTLSPYDAFANHVNRMLFDMRYRQSQGGEPKAQLFPADARECSDMSDRSVDLVVTSPPYANNYDYADATRLEMSFFGEVRGWGDLHAKARRYLLRSCSQHVSLDKTDLNQTLSQLSDAPFLSEIEQVCVQLHDERLQHGGKKDYHIMVAAYFADMKRVWQALRRVCKTGATACFVVGDSAPYGIYVPVDRWLGELAVMAGFTSYGFEKVRDRNVKWKNRKHRVPLHEGRLWVKG